jgi:hypothetical protein
MHHHHTPLVSPDHIAVIVAVGTLVCLLGAAFIISWRDSGDKLRSILSEIDSPPMTGDLVPSATRAHLPDPAPNMPTQRRPASMTVGPDSPTK